jgi:integration host factor subunit beta
MKMTKADLIEDVSRALNTTLRESEVIVEAIFDKIVCALRVNDKMEIRGFGSFRTRQRQPRLGRNPTTGARVDVPARRITFFTPSKDLNEVVNGVKETGGPRPDSADAPTSCPFGPRAPHQRTY